jgi:hypothetical protein
MSQTIEHVVNSVKTNEAVEWAKNIIEQGEVKNTPTGTKYVIINTNEI